MIRTAPLIALPLLLFVGALGALALISRAEAEPEGEPGR